MPKAPEPSSTCQKTTKSLPRISPKSYCYNAVPNRFLAHFSTSRTNGPRLLSRAKAGTHSPSPTGSHTRAYTPKHGPFRTEGAISTLGPFHTFANLPGPGIRTAYFAAFGSWSGHSRRTRRAFGTAIRLCASLFRRRRGPAGLRDLFSFLSKLWLTHPVLRAFRVCETWEVSLPSACSSCC